MFTSPAPREFLKPAILVSGMIATANPLAGILPGMPDAVVCSVKDPTGTLPWERLVFYASAQTSDQRTLYKTLTSDPVVIFVDQSGRIEGANLADCDGYTVEQLRSEGRAFDLTTP